MAVMITPVLANNNNRSNSSPSSITNKTPIKCTFNTRSHMANVNSISRSPTHLLTANRSGPRLHPVISKTHIAAHRPSNRALLNNNSPYQPHKPNFLRSHSSLNHHTCKRRSIMSATST
jgi:hypothetical protein